MSLLLLFQGGGINPPDLLAVIRFANEAPAAAQTTAESLSQAGAALTAITNSGGTGESST